MGGSYFSRFIWITLAVVCLFVCFCLSGEAGFTQIDVTYKVTFG